MVDTTQHRDATPAQATPDGPTPSRRSGSSVHGTVSAVSGAVGVVVAILPMVGVAGVLLAVLAIATGVPAMRGGPAGAGFHRGRTGVVLGMIAFVVGLAGLAAELL